MSRLNSKDGKFGILHKAKYSSFFLIFLISTILMFLGIVFVFEASSIRAFNEMGDSFYYLKLQSMWVAIGLLVMLVVSQINYKIFLSLSPYLMGVTFFLLILVLLPFIGKTAGGARSWIDLGFFNLQPSEFAKSALIIYLSFRFANTKNNNFWGFLIFLGSVTSLIMFQPDMGATIMIFLLGISMYFISGKPLLPLMSIIPIAIAVFVALVIAAPYRLKRLTAFLRPNEDPLGVSFHINQILISITEGGFFGRGFGASRSKYLFLPEAHTDSIFAIISEELGFIGSVFIFFLYTILLYNIYLIYANLNDYKAKMLVGGVFIYFGLQIIINLGGMVNLMPLTGVTLPLISYGGSSIFTSCLLIGVVLSIAKLHKNEKY